MKTLSKKTTPSPVKRSRKGSIAVPASVPALPSVFTVRDMNRNGRALLEAAKFHGRVTIRSRSGEEYQVSLSLPVQTFTPKPDFLERMRQHQLKMRELGVMGPKTEDARDRLNRIIAGEE